MSNYKSINNKKINHEINPDVMHNCNDNEEKYTKLSLTLIADKINTINKSYSKDKANGFKFILAEKPITITLDDNGSEHKKPILYTFREFMVKLWLSDDGNFSGLIGN